MNRFLYQEAERVQAERIEAAAKAERDRITEAALVAARVADDRMQRASAVTAERRAAEAAAEAAAIEMAEFNYLQMLSCKSPLASRTRTNCVQRQTI